MAIVFACGCGREIAAPDLAAGQRTHCPRCGAVLRVPAASEIRPDPAHALTWKMLVGRAKAARPAKS
jgi:uncharacterized paraquat-inducible protein A